MKPTKKNEWFFFKLWLDVYFNPLTFYVIRF